MAYNTLQTVDYILWFAYMRMSFLIGVVDRDCVREEKEEKMTEEWH